jgi:hypothetical protein
MREIREGKVGDREKGRERDIADSTNFHQQSLLFGDRQAKAKRTYLMIYTCPVHKRATTVLVLSVCHYPPPPPPPPPPELGSPPVMIRAHKSGNTVVALY